MEALKKAQARVDGLRAALAQMDAMDQADEPPSLDDLRAIVYEPLTIRDEPEAGRRVLKGLLTEPITVTPVVEDGRVVGWDYLGHASLDRVLAGQIGASVTKPITTMVVPPG